MQNLKSEKEFEDALVENLKKHGWVGAEWLNGGNPVIEYPTEEDLINNWCDILQNNNSRTLNNLPLIQEEREMLAQKVAEIATPYEANVFINNVVCIIRQNEDDVVNYNRPVYLTLYDKEHIGGGDSVYQIVRQPIFNRNSSRPLSRDRRGDVMMLINGLPLIHIELKRSGIEISEATSQIRKYIDEGKFRNNFFTLIQMFVAMTPNECMYFANTTAGKLNDKFFFHWADKNNKIINSWTDISKTLLSIPLAHKMVGYYTIADSADHALKILRSYQCHAVDQIYRRGLHLWDSNDHVHGGYCYHCTGSGKTMTSFKAAERLGTIPYVDKVVFLVDRSDLNEQSTLEFKNFADDSDDVNDAKNTYSLYEKLRRKNKGEIIVCTIQKLNHLCESDYEKYENFCETAKEMKCIFITDECHRSQFGEMCSNIRRVFRQSSFFGFTGTPIYDENSKYGLKTSDIFGDVLSVYSIADGIRNGDVLGFDVEWVDVFKRKDYCAQVLMQKYNCSEEEVYRDYMDEYNAMVEMEGVDFERKYVPKQFYELEHTREEIVEDIIENQPRISRGGMFHGIFAVSCIADAVEYYQLFRKKAPNLKVTAIFTLLDQGEKIDQVMELEILKDYNTWFDQNFDMANISGFEKNVALRLAHKKEMKGLSREEQLDIVIVVDKLLTGYDSKYVNALYLDKELKNEALIQAFSRTNRVLNEAKTHGIIRAYRKPNTMKQNLDAALKLYADADKNDMFVSKLYTNVGKINDNVDHILEMFIDENGELDLNNLPEDKVKVQDFVNTFNKLERTLNAAKLQGLEFDKIEYVNEDEVTDEMLILKLDEDLYETLKARYSDVEQKKKENPDDYLIVNIDYKISEQRVLIDKEYIEKYFNDYLHAKETNETEEQLAEIRDDLIKSLGKLKHEEQEIALMILNDIDRGEFNVVPNHTFFDYLNDYINVQKEGLCKKIADILNLDYEELLKLKVEADNLGNPGISLSVEPHHNNCQCIKTDSVMNKFRKRTKIYEAYLEGNEVVLNAALKEYE